jgi:hypothetical protein
MHADSRHEHLRRRAASVFRGREAIGAGLLTRKQLRSRAWRCLYRDVYADAELSPTHGIAIAGAALLAPPSAVFSGRSAAYLLGADSLVDPAAPVELTVPEEDRFGPVTGLRRRRTGRPAPAWPPAAGTTLRGRSFDALGPRHESCPPSHRSRRRAVGVPTGVAAASPAAAHRVEACSAVRCPGRGPDTSWPG